MDAKELILDYSKWRCGYTTPSECKHQLGEGPVRLLNEKGFSCCIGQFCAQSGVDASLLLDRSSPADVPVDINLFNMSIDNSAYQDSALTEDCIIINDDPETSPEVKIKLLTNRLAKEGIALTVINHPQH